MGAPSVSKSRAYTSASLLEEHLARRGVATEEGLQSIGARLARLRKEKGITQVEMAQRLGVAQPVVSNYERGSFRLHGELIVQLARILEVSTDELLGVEPRPRAAVPRDRRLLRRLEAFDTLPKRDRDALTRTIDAFLALRTGRSGGRRAA